MFRTTDGCSARVRIVLATILAAFAFVAGGLPTARAAATAQRSGARVTARLNSGVVRLGDNVRLQINVENANYSEVTKIPEVDGLSIGPVGRPSLRTSFTSINGRGTTVVERTWVIPIRPEDTGDYRIPPIELNVDGEIVRTQELTVTVRADLKGEELGFFEIRPSSTKVVEGQPFAIELTFGWDVALRERINFANLSLPWWGQLSGALENEQPSTSSANRQYEIYLNSSQKILVEQVDPQTIDGRTYRTFRVVRSFTPTRSAELEFPTSFLEFGQVVESGSFSFFERRREKAESFFVRADEFTIDVIPLPEEGRPLDFSGAIGSLQVRASAEPRDVDVGDSIKFQLEYSGSGNLEFFETPDPSRLPEFSDFRVYGKTEDRSFDRRTVVYDIAPLADDVDHIPPLPLPVFDPELGRYTRLESPPIEIRVRPLADARELVVEDETDERVRDIRDIEPRPGTPRGSSRPGAALALGSLALAPLLWMATRGIARRRADPDSPVERRRRKARRVLARALKNSGGARGQLDALLGFLAARSREGDQAWQGRSISDWAATGGSLEPQACQSLDELISELERATWRSEGAAGAGPEGGAALPATRILQVADDVIRGGL